VVHLRSAGHLRLWRPPAGRWRRDCWQPRPRGL